MKRTHQLFPRSFAALALCLMLVAGAWAQSIVSGDITGTVTDPSGAVVPGAKVTLRNNDTGQTQTVNTNPAGVYRFALLKPGRYTVSVNQQGFNAASQGAFVAVGQVTRADVRLSVGQQTQTVEVTAETPLVQSDTGNTSTSFNAAQIESSPAPGGDITTIAELAPGVQTNTSSGGGYGNFSSNGVPATSNLYTVNGNDEMDPYLNLNNSGASNLTLGNNELADVTVTTNGYSGEFGRNAGAQVNYATKSGTNHFHGNAIYNWSGAALNARDWFVTGAAPNTHDHQWAASVGGPIFKDKTFFFVDTEGIKYTLPTSNEVLIPSPAFQASTLAAVTPLGEGPFYQQMFNLWNSAPGAQNAAPTNDPAVYSFRNAVTNSAHEWILIGRVDHQFSQADRVFFRYRTDRGLQPTYTDPINPVFNAESVQPQDEGQATWTHTFKSAAVNQFIVSGLYYSAIFRPVNQTAALSAFPYAMLQGAGPFTGLGGENYAFPQGRNTGQFGLVDDFALTLGNHSMKFGINLRHDNVTDFVYSEREIFPLVELLSSDTFASGAWDAYLQRFSARSSQPFSLYSLGFYAQDQWKFSNRLTLTLSLRGDRNSNPRCGTHCISEAADGFDRLNHDPTIPYNQVLINGQSNAFHELENIAWEPRFGFAFTPMASGHTVLRGGIGFFADISPGVFAEFFSRNVPQQNSFTVQDALAAPGVVGSAQTAAATANSALLGIYNGGGTAADLVAAETSAGVVAAFPNLNAITRRVTNPKYLKYNLEIQQAFGTKTSLSINYNGNHGRDIFVNNPGLNAFCTPARCGSAVNGFPSVSGTLSSRQSPVDGRFGSVTMWSNSGTSDYNGVTISLQRRYATFQMAVAYTWSHATDDVSNGGVNPYSNNDSIITQIDPHCLKCQNQGNADYDIRHYLQANYSWTPGYKFKNGFLDSALAGWTLSNTYFFRTGLPFSIYDDSLSQGLIRYDAGVLLLDQPKHFTCGAPGPSHNDCFNDLTLFGPYVALNGTADPAVGVASNQTRNQNRGPKYFDSDVALSKTFKLRENLRLGVGVNAFNVFNHPNFANPVNDLSSGSTFGTVQNTVSPPTSPFGAFAGASASGRVMQLNARVTF